MKQEAKRKGRKPIPPEQRKKTLSLRISPEAYRIIDEQSSLTGNTKASIIESAIMAGITPTHETVKVSGALNVNGAALWMNCPASAQYQDQTIEVPEGDKVMTLDWANHPEISYHGPSHTLNNGILSLKGKSFLQPMSDTVLMFQLFGALWGASSEMIGAAVLETQSGHVQVDLKQLPDIRDTLTAGIEKALSASPEYVPGAHCGTCPHTGCAVRKEG